MKKRRVVITGIGVIAPNGVGREQFWRACLEGLNPVSTIPPKWKRWATTASTIWSPLPAIDFLAYALDRVEIMQTDMCARMACATVKMALDDAGFELTQKNAKLNSFTIKDIDALRWGVIWGTGTGGVATLIENSANHILIPAKERLGSSGADFIDGRMADLLGLMESGTRVNPFGISMVMPNSCSAKIGIKYSVHGANRTLTSACAAGTVSVGHAFSAIQSGLLDCAITGGSEYLGDHYGVVFRAFDIPGALVRNCSDPSKANCPFDTNRSGFLFSEGGASALILEDLDHALRRNAPIVAEIVSYAETFDAHSIMMLDPSGEQVRRMIHAVLDEAGIDPGDMDYINTHGTGTEHNDDIESSILYDIFGTRPLVNSTKSLIGHTIGASGAIEAAVTALSVLNDTTHVSKNIENPINGLSFVRMPVARCIRTALTESFAFGGHNASLVMRKFEK